MAVQFPLVASGGAQVVSVIGGAIGSHALILSFASAPSAGTVSIEYRLIGSSVWVLIDSGLDVTSGEVLLYVDGPIAAFRVEFSSLVGGKSPALWLTTQPTAIFPLDLMTDGGDGPNRRLRIDQAQTGFFAGREFRTFKEWTTATTATYVIKAVVPIDIILFELGVAIEEGSVRIETLIGGVEGGTFSETLPIFSTNTMTEKPQPPYVGQVVLTAGGTLTGGTLLDPLRAKTSGVSNFASNVGATTGAERGVGPATYYFRITLTGAIGVFKARYEERI